MKIAAFNTDGTCGCMANTVLELIGILIDQGAIIDDYTFYYINDSNPLELSVTHRSNP